MIKARFLPPKEFKARTDALFREWSEAMRRTQACLARTSTMPEGQARTDVVKEARTHLELAKRSMRERQQISLNIEQTAASMGIPTGAPDPAKNMYTQYDEMVVNLEEVIEQMCPQREA